MGDAEVAAKGRRAQIELRETEEAFGKLRSAMLEKLASTPPEQEATILKLHLAVQTLGAVRQALLTVVQDGQVADQALALSGLNRA